MSDHPKPADYIPHVSEAQRREEIAAAERKRHAARTMEELKARFGDPEA